MPSSRPKRFPRFPWDRRNQMELCVKTTCARFPVGVLQLNHYQNFARELNKATGMLHGEDLRGAALALVGKYVLQVGMDERVLRAIAYGVFTLDVPSVPAAES
jgi:hypothetical protein